MSHSEAERLAAEVILGGVVWATVERQDRYFVVVADAPSGRYTLRDGADWSWLRGRISGNV